MSEFRYMLLLLWLRLGFHTYRQTTDDGVSNQVPFGWESTVPLLVCTYSYRLSITRQMCPSLEKRESSKYHPKTPKTRPTNLPPESSYEGRVKPMMRLYQCSR